MAKAKNTGLLCDQVAAAINARLGRSEAGVFSRGKGFAGEVTSFVPFGVAAADRYALGGGLACGRFAELYGEEGAGKSTLVLHAAAQCQNAGGTAVLIHTEHALTRSRLIQLNVDPDELVLIEPSDMEDCLRSIESACAALAKRPNKAKTPALIAWDSLASAPTTAERRAGVAPAKGFDIRAKLMSAALRVLAGAAVDANAAVLVVNQNRMKIGVMFGNPTTTPGGAAPKYIACHRIELYPGKAIKVAGVPVGRFVTFKVWKNKVGPPLRKVSLELFFRTGFDDDRSTVLLARQLGLVGSREGLAAAKAALERTSWQPGDGLVDEEGDEGEDEGDDV